MVKIFLTADMAVGIAPLAVKFAYKNFKYLFKNWLVSNFIPTDSKKFEFQNFK